MIEFRCAHCGESVEVDDQFAGLKGQCPECGQVIVIPRTSETPASDKPARSLDGPTIHGPRRMVVPKSVLNVDANVQSQATETTGPASGITPTVSMILAVLPCLSVLGLIFGGICWSRAKKAGHSGRRRLAQAATIVALLWTLAQLIGGTALLVASVQIGIATGEEESCREAMAYIGADLAAQASTAADGALPSRMATSGYSGYMYYDYRCPCSHRLFGYVGDLVYDSSARTIFLYDPEPAHGYQTWIKSRPDGRNVYRMDGSSELLSEDAFQKEMADQAARLGHPWSAGR